jgi:hypothetical protein
MVRSEESWNLAAFALLADNLGARFGRGLALAGQWNLLSIGVHLKEHSIVERIETCVIGNVTRPH